tara:strand:+ start:3119 stop:3292 length:174 start_codon:yes stop_codon:yes gene_type:complete
MVQLQLTIRKRIRTTIEALSRRDHPNSKTLEWCSKMGSSTPNKHQIDKPIFAQGKIS